MGIESERRCRTLPAGSERAPDGRRLAREREVR